MLEGITAGFILSLTLYPGTVWLTKVGIAGSRSQIFSVGFGFWCSHVFWLLVAVPGLMMMTAHLPFIRFAMHLFASFVLAYMGYKFLRSKKVQLLNDAPVLSGNWSLFRSAFAQSLAMPMRLPAAMAILLSTGVYINNVPSWETVPRVLLGALIGVTWWWGQFALLSLIFAKRVPQPITIKSLNRLRPFSTALCFSLAGIVLFFGL